MSIKPGEIYKFQVIRSIMNRDRRCCIIQDQFGIKHTLPFNLRKNLKIPLFVTKNKSNSLSFSLLKCSMDYYELGEIYLFEVKKLIKDERGKNIIIVTDRFKREFSVLAFDWQLFEKTKPDRVKCVVLNIHKNKIWIKQVNQNNIEKYKVNQNFKFKVIAFKYFEKKNSSTIPLFCLCDEDENLFTVYAFPWQLESNNYPNQISCKVIEIYENRVLKLNQVFEKDDHPSLLFNERYYLKFIDIIDTVTENEPNLIKVADKKGNHFQVIKPFDIEFNHLVGTEIPYTFKGLDSKGNPRFQYFKSFEDIINFRALKRLTFDSLKELKEDERVVKLFNDYNDKENIWIFSFCDILKSRIGEFLRIKDYEIILIYIEVFIKVEKWIIDSGFLNTFRPKKRLETLKYANNEISRQTALSRALELILENQAGTFISSFCSKIEFPNKKEYEKEARISWLLIQLTYDEDSFNFPLLVNFFFKIGNKNFFQEELKNWKSVIPYFIDQKIKELEISLFSSKVFINYKRRDSFYIGNKYVKRLIFLSYIRFLIEFNSKDLNLQILFLIKFFKYKSFYSDNLLLKEESIRIALLIDELNFQDLDGLNNLSTWENLLNFEHLIEFKFYPKKHNTIEDYQRLYTSYKNQKILKGKIAGIDKYGFFGYIGKNRIILPKYLARKNYNEGNSSFFKINLIDNQFNKIIVSEIQDRVNLSNEIEICESGIYKGKVKRFESYGAFISLGEVDGLIHLSELSNLKVKHPSHILSIGETVKVKVLRVDKESNQFHLSRKLVLDEERKEKIEIGKKTKGIVTGFNENNGVFVELFNGEVGLIHIKNIAWNEVHSIRDFLNIKEQVEVLVIDRKEDGRLSLSLKETVDNPFLNESLLSKQFEGEIINCFDLNSFSSYYEFSINSEKVEEKTSCPKCHYESKFLITKNFDIATKEKTLYINHETGITHCQNCDWEITELFLIKIKELRIVAAYNLKGLDLNQKEYLKKTLEIGSKLNVIVENIDKKSKYIDVNINIDSIKKFKIQIINSEYSKELNNEIGSCYEQFAFLNTDYENKINILKFSKYFYSNASSPKSYYLNINISYMELLKIFETKLSKLEVQIEKVLEKAKSILLEIRTSEVSIQVFPDLKNLVFILETLVYFEQTSNSALDYLYNLSQDHNEDFDVHIKLSKLLLSHNLILSETKNNSRRRENWEGIYNLLLEGLVLLEEKEEEDIETIKKRKEILKVLEIGETNEIEFKSTIEMPVLSKSGYEEIFHLQKRIDLETNEQEKVKITNNIFKIKDVKYTKALGKILNHSILKTLAALANSNGGLLYVGISEDRNECPFILGIEEDFKKLKSKDGMIRKLDEIISKHIGDSFNSAYLQTEFIKIYDKEVLKIKVKKSERKKIYLDWTKNGVQRKDFYVRRQGSTITLEGKELVDYIETRFHK